MTRVQTEKNASIQRLQQLLNSKEHEVQVQFWFVAEKNIVKAALRISRGSLFTSSASLVQGTLTMLIIEL